MRQPANASKLLAFFNGEAADNKLFVFYQPPAVDQGDVDAEGWPGNEQPPELFFSQGSTTRLTTKCCVFVRAVPPGTAIDLTKQSTAELLYCEALVAVSRGFIGNFEMSCSSEIKDNLMTHMGMVHKLTTDVCSEYFEKLRRAVYQTPKSYLSFIQSYTKMYKLKLAELEDKEGRVKLGLEKLKQGARDVEDMKGVLAEEDKKLAVATEETNKMLEGLQISSAEAQREGDKVAKDKAACEADAARIGEEKAAAEADLAKAQPFVDKANKAIASIKPKDIQEIKANKNPTDIIKMIFDCILILFKQPLDTVKPTTLSVKKEDLAYFETSFKFSGQKMLGGTTFLADLQEFGKTGKDLMNEETVEFLFPYVDLSLEQNGAYFTPEVAKKASSAAEGLCIFAAAMKDYFYASRVVKPKLEALGIAEANLNEAAAKLRQAEARLKTCQDKLDELQAMFERQTAEKKLIEDNAAALQKTGPRSRSSSASSRSGASRPRASTSTACSSTAPPSTRRRASSSNRSPRSSSSRSRSSSSPASSRTSPTSAARSSSAPTGPTSAPSTSTGPARTASSSSSSRSSAPPRRTRSTGRSAAPRSSRRTPRRPRPAGGSKASLGRKRLFVLRFWWR